MRTATGTIGVPPGYARSMGFSPAQGERVIFSDRPSWKAILSFYLKGIVIAVLVCILASLVGLGFLPVSLIAFVIIGVTVLFGFVKRWSTVYTISDRRLNISRGVFAREIQEARLERIQNISFTQSPLERILGIGNVDFDTASTGDGNLFVFGGVDNPQEVVDQVDAALRSFERNPPGPAL